MIARSWQGLAKRWTGTASVPAVRDLLDVAVPVIVVGQDACDNGGMIAVDFLSLGGGQRMQAVLTSDRGFTLYGGRSRFGAAGAWSLIVHTLGASPAAPGAPGTVRTSAPLRNVVATVTGEVGAAPADWARLPVPGASSVAVIRPQRPIIVPPDRFLVLGGSGNAGTQEVTVFVEEGL